ncbi:ISL3 family transposase [Acinetobacter guillouiae]|uniref:ISL3 family transposase n=1 Tax=Acinetobacter guillouiae TaxID=106649 RepID=UPI002E1DA0CE|nr:ISL3 family transposase [Acinetobacter guillouiae]
MVIDLLQLDGFQSIDYRHEDEHIIITVNPTNEHLQNCPECKGLLYRHGERSNQFADTPMQMTPVTLEVVRTRYRCRDCKKVVMAPLAFLDEKRRASTRLIQQIRKRCLDQTFTHLSQETGLVVNTVKNITLDFIEELERELTFETPSIMGIDELKLNGTYRCVITNLAMNSIYDMLPERTQDTLIPYFSRLPDAEKVEWICSDMWRPFKKSFNLHLPNAKLVIDKFHVVRMASEALETERKALQGSMNRIARLNLKKNLRWILLKRPKSLTEEQLGQLQDIELHFPQLKEAYDLKEQFYEIYDAQTKDGAIKRFRDWEENIPPDLKSYLSVAKTVNNHFEDIFAYWDAPVRLTNAYTEGHNGLTRVANRMGRGYTFEVIRAKMLYNKIARSITTLSNPTKPHSTIITKTDGLAPPDSTNSVVKKREFGSHIPTLVDIFEDIELDQN